MNSVKNFGLHVEMKVTKQHLITESNDQENVMYGLTENKVRDVKGEQLKYYYSICHEEQRVWPPENQKI